MRIFLDTNVVVSALATRGICSDILRVIVSEHDLLLSETVLRELGRVLDRKFGVPADAVQEAGDFLREEAAAVVRARRPQPGVTLRDPDDVAIVEEAVASNADLLVTADRDLLDVAAEMPVVVVSPREFWALVRETDEERLE